MRAKEEAPGAHPEQSVPTTLAVPPAAETTRRWEALAASRLGVEPWVQREVVSQPQRLSVALKDRSSSVSFLPASLCQCSGPLERLTFLESYGPDLGDDRPRAFPLAVCLLDCHVEARSRLDKAFWHDLHGTPSRDFPDPRRRERWTHTLPRGWKGGAGSRSCRVRQPLRVVTSPYTRFPRKTQSRQVEGRSSPGY